MKRHKKNQQAGEAFKQLMKDKGFTQYKLEQVTGLDKSLISKIANGYTASPKPITLQKIADALGVELGVLTRIFAEPAESSQYTETYPQPEAPAAEVKKSLDPNFVGREDAIAHLDNLVNEGAKVILIQAEGGVGKTTLAQKWFEYQGLEYLELRVGTTTENIQPVEDWVRLKLRDYFQETPEQNFMTMLEQFKSKLQNGRLGVLIDNLEPALINGEFIQPHRNYGELLTVLAQTNVDIITLITSRELLYESTVKDINIYKLDSLSKNAWENYFKRYKICIDDDALSKMYRAYGGNAEAMSLLAADIHDEFKGDLCAYWQRNSRYLLVNNHRLENLVKYQFDKIQKDCPSAYKLLCRLGIYRYHYISGVPEDGLFCLLWDEPIEKNQRRIVRILKDRALVKFSQEGYYLHQVICEEAVERLKLLGEWEASHRAAGLFWCTLVSSKSNNYQSSIVKIIGQHQQFNDIQEQMFLNIDNAKQVVQQHPLIEQESILEIIYHVGEFYHTNSLDELSFNPKLSDNAFFKAVRQSVYEYIDCHQIMGICLGKFAILLQLLAVDDENLCQFTESKKKFEYCKRSFQSSQYFFQNILLIANKIKANNLVNKVKQCLAEIHYLRGLSLDYLGIYLYQTFRIQESESAFKEGRDNFQKSAQIFTEIQASQELRRVRQAMDSLEISAKCCSKLITSEIKILQ